MNKKAENLESRNIRSTYEGGMRTGNVFDRKNDPVRYLGFARADFHKWTPHPEPSDVVPHRTTNPTAAPITGKILECRHGYRG